MTLLRDPDWRVVLAAALLALAVWINVAMGEEAPRTPVLPANEATRCVCEWPANGAAVNEPLVARIARLETALRLSKAERVVNRKARKR